MCVCVCVCVSVHACVHVKDKYKRIELSQRSHMWELRPRSKIILAVSCKIWSRQKRLGSYILRACVISGGVAERRLEGGNGRT